MWNTIRVKSEDYFLSVTDSGEAYEFLLSNLKCIWKNKLEEREIVDIIHELNPQIEATPKVLVKKAIASLSERSAADEIDCTKELCGITLKATSKIGGFPFIFDLQLNLVSHENQIFHELTLPLVLMVHMLKEKEQKLLGIIKLKDKEIEDYRLGGAQLSHKILKTKVFDEKEHFSGSSDSKKVSEVVESPTKYFSSSLSELFESAKKEMSKHKAGEGSGNGAQVKVLQHSPDLFDESDEPEPKVLAVPRKMPTLLKVELKPKRTRAKKHLTATKKLQI